MPMFSSMPKFPLPSPGKIALWLASPFIVLAVAGLFADSAEARARNNVAYASVAALKNNLGSPRRLEFERVRVTDTGAACIQYRARDDFGTLSSAQAVVIGGKVAQSSARDGRFEKEWNRQCLGSTYDVTGAVDRFF